MSTESLSCIRVPVEDYPYIGVSFVLSVILAIVFAKYQLSQSKAASGNAKRKFTIVQRVSAFTFITGDISVLLQYIIYWVYECRHPHLHWYLQTIVWLSNGSGIWLAALLQVMRIQLMVGLIQDSRLKPIPGILLSITTVIPAFGIILYLVGSLTLLYSPFDLNIWIYMRAFSLFCNYSLSAFMMFFCDFYLIYLIFKTKQRLYQMSNASAIRLQKIILSSIIMTLIMALLATIVFLIISSSTDFTTKAYFWQIAILMLRIYFCIAVTYLHFVQKLVRSTNTNSMLSFDSLKAKNSANVSKSVLDSGAPRGGGDSVPSHSWLSRTSRAFLWSRTNTNAVRGPDNPSWSWF